MGETGVLLVPFHGYATRSCMTLVNLTPSVDSAYMSADIGRPGELGHGIRPALPKLRCHSGCPQAFLVPGSSAPWLYPPHDTKPLYHIRNLPVALSWRAVMYVLSQRTSQILSSASSGLAASFDTGPTATAQPEAAERLARRGSVNSRTRGGGTAAAALAAASRPGSSSIAFVRTRNLNWFFPDFD